MKKLFGVLLATVILLSSILLPVSAEYEENKDDSRLDIGDIFGYSNKITFIDGENATEEVYLENSPIIYPQLTPSREYDNVWSQSQEEYIPRPKTMLREEITVYSFKNPVIGFENYPSVPYADDSVAVGVTSDFAFAGDNSFKYHNIHTSNSREHSMALGKATKGVAYKIKFKYYVNEALKTEHTITPYTGHSNLIEDGNDENGKRVEYTASKFNILDTTKTNTWLDGEIYFTASQFTFGDYDYIYLLFASETVNQGDSIYFDNFTVEEMITADFILPEGFKTNSTNGTLSGNTFTAYFNQDVTITAPEVLTEDGTPVAWVDEDGLVCTEFKANGIYRVNLNGKGDINVDGAVTTLDLALMKLYLVEKKDLSEINVNNGDIDLNGKVDLVDLAYLKLHLAGIIEKL